MPDSRSDSRSDTTPDSAPDFEDLKPWQKLTGGLRRLGEAVGLDALHRRYLLDAFWLALIVRGALWMLAYFAGRVIAKNGDPLWPLFYNVFSRWDSINFYLIAEKGYTFIGEEQRLLAFFPVFPWLLRTLGYVFMNYLIPGLLISFVASVLAGYFLQALVALDYGDATARRALKYFFVFPTAYFLCLPYTEALFLALTLGAWYAARQERWGLAGVAGLLAALTRLQGLVLFPALLLEAWLQRERLSWTRQLGVLLVPAGFGLYLLLNWVVSGGDPLAFTKMQQQYWGNHMVPPWQPVADSLAYLFAKGPATEQGTSVEIVRLVTVGLTGLSLLLGIRRIRASYQLYAWAQFVMVMLSSWLMSLPRYVLCLFPLYIVYARLSDSEAFHERLSTFSTLLMGGLALVYFTGFWAY